MSAPAFHTGVASSALWHWERLIICILIWVDIDFKGYLCRSDVSLICIQVSLALEDASEGYRLRALTRSLMFFNLNFKIIVCSSITFLSIINDSLFRGRLWILLLPFLLLRHAISHCELLMIIILFIFFAIDDGSKWWRNYLDLKGKEVMTILLYFVIWKQNGSIWFKL